MPLCPIDQKTTIEWQYPGETKQRIEGADDYSIDPIYAGYTRYFWEYEIDEAWSSYSGTYITSVNQACNRIPGLHRQCSSQSKRSNANSGAAKRRELVYAPIYKYRVTDFKNADAPCSPGGEFPCIYVYGYRQIDVLCHGGATPSATPVWVTVFDGKSSTSGNGQMLRYARGGEFVLSYDSVLDLYNFNPGQQPDWNYFRFFNWDNRKPTQYLFKVLKNESAVYQRTKVDKPIVTHFCGEKCPPGTCECTCGNRVCCHNPVTGAVIKSFIK
jgi:hypothetical protein